MVTETETGGRKLFACGECGLAYRERELAEKCERWCMQHHTCNIEIYRHAVFD